MPKQFDVIVIGAGPGGYIAAIRAAQLDFNDLSSDEGRRKALAKRARLGDRLFAQRVPSLDGSLKGWLAVMETLRGMPARLVIPGHGLPSAHWPGAMQDQERYLQALLRDVGQAIRDRKTLSQAVENAAGGERSRWLLFDDYHPRNVTTAYTELEWEN